MMEKKAAVIVAEGFEESETLTIVDILRRAEIRCDLVGLVTDVVKGAHDVVVRTDCVMDEGLVDYDMVSESNLQRQVLYSEAETGKPKALCAKKRLEALNHEPHAEDFEILPSFHIIVEWYL